MCTRVFIFGFSLVNDISSFWSFLIYWNIRTCTASGPNSPCLEQDWCIWKWVLVCLAENGTYSKSQCLCNLRWLGRCLRQPRVRGFLPDTFTPQRGRLGGGGGGVGGEGGQAHFCFHEGTIHLTVRGVVTYDTTCRRRQEFFLPFRWERNLPAASWAKGSCYKQAGSSEDRARSQHEEDRVEKMVGNGVPPLPVFSAPRNHAFLYYWSQVHKDFLSFLTFKREES